MDIFSNLYMHMVNMYIRMVKTWQPMKNFDLLLMDGDTQSNNFTHLQNS